MDKLKKYYEEHPEERDIYSTDLDSLWSGVEGNLDKRDRKRNTFTLLKIAASLILLVGVTFFLGRSTGNDPKLSEVIETENYYSDLIQDKMQLINNRSHDIDPIIFSDLEILDQAMEELKEDLKDNADNEEVIRAMVKNYQVKLEILEQILEQIDEEENVEKNI